MEITSSNSYLTKAQSDELNKYKSLISEEEFERMQCLLSRLFINEKDVQLLAIALLRCGAMKILDDDEEDENSEEEGSEDEASEDETEDEEESDEEESSEEELDDESVSDEESELEELDTKVSEDGDLTEDL